jgi:glycosyltransferase involved in cell wall biosynthesis
MPDGKQADSGGDGVRNGQNPNRDAFVEGYAPVVVSAITHLPNQKGYHKKRFDVIRASLETMRRNAGADCQIVIWDNGSCANLKAWLINEYRPDYLIFSKNVGKSIARASIVNMLPPSTVVGVADDDMFYYPDWLAAQLEILAEFPDVGTVSGWPVRTQFRFHCESTVRWAMQNADEFEAGRFISPKEDKDFCTSIGRDYEWHSGEYTENDRDYLMVYKGIQAYATGHHAQWIGIAGIVSPFLTYTKEAMADERPFERAVNNAGLLRLTTYKRYTRHIGNALDQELEALWHERESVTA